MKNLHVNIIYLQQTKFKLDFFAFKLFSEIKSTFCFCVLDLLNFILFIFYAKFLKIK